MTREMSGMGVQVLVDVGIKWWWWKDIHGVEWSVWYGWNGINE